MVAFPTKLKNRNGMRSFHINLMLLSFWMKSASTVIISSKLLLRESYQLGCLKKHYKIPPDLPLQREETTSPFGKGGLRGILGIAALAQPTFFKNLSWFKDS